MRLDQPISTYLSCPQGMQQEGVYLSALVSVISYKITGSSLEIVYDKGNGLLKYEAQAQPSGTPAPSSQTLPGLRNPRSVEDGMMHKIK